ncbi:MAG TPA: lanthionine synthetase LanC family protein [Solirubrobacteraceae bacterium]|nr:lanthionine synthetase LanC family protein [Solirubrobacteraceae bacterium]
MSEAIRSSAADVAGDVPARGGSIGRFTVTGIARDGAHAAVLQARDHAGSYVALKVARTQTGACAVKREAALLRSLPDRGPWPAYAAAGELDRTYLATHWVHGVEARRAAAEDRDAGRSDELLGLCRRIARAYADLNASGALHGRVHPRHVLVDGDGSVHLLDFALAIAPAGVGRLERPAASIEPLGAPEQIEAALAGAAAVPTGASEQYSLAALLYLLLTGRMYVRAGRGRSEVAHAILTNAPLSFAGQGARPWPPCEAVFARALSKHPSGRYDSIEQFARALEAVPARQAPAAPKPLGAPPQAGATRLATLLAEFRRDAGSEATPMALPAPTCSINFGAAGIAYALTRLGKVTGDTAAFAHAERWLAEAERRSRDDDAFDDGDELTPETVGVVSPYHNVSGISAARVLLSEAMGDDARQQSALDEFRISTAAPCANLDLTLGRSSVLLFAALLYKVARPEWPAAQRLATYGDELCAGIWRDVPQAPIGYHGIAHGWAGVAYAALMWSRARDASPPPGVRGLLEILSRIAEPSGRGARWPLTPPKGPDGDVFWPGWCHGTAGYVFLWNLAHSVYGEERYVTLAERAAWLTNEPSGITSLCCGSAGQVYAALNQYRASSDERWRRSAVAIAERAATHDALADDATSPMSLYKGHAGLALLSVELGCPQLAAMPLFEFEPSAQRCTSSDGKS